MPFLIRASLNKKPQTFNFTGKSLSLRLSIENGSKGARTLGLPLVRRALIPAELCFHDPKYSTNMPDWEDVFSHIEIFLKFYLLSFIPSDSEYSFRVFPCILCQYLLRYLHIFSKIPDNIPDILRHIRPFQSRHIFRRYTRERI